MPKRRGVKPVAQRVDDMRQQPFPIADAGQFVRAHHLFGDVAADPAGTHPLPARPEQQRWAPPGADRAPRKGET